MLQRRTVGTRGRLVAFAAAVAVSAAGVTGQTWGIGRAVAPRGPMLGVDGAGSASVERPVQDKAAEAAASAAYQRLPLRFDANRGQVNAQVDFVSRGPGYTAFLARTETVLRLGGATGSTDPAVVRMRLSGARAGRPGEGSQPLEGVSNYLLGADESRWVTGVPGFAKVTYGGVYPGIDLVYYGDRQERLEYDFVVAPGADPSVIALSFAGHRRLRLNDEGDLVVATSAGELVERRPVVYQRVGGERRSVTAAYRVVGDRVRFTLGDYDRALPLVIDPVLEYSSYLGGGSVDEANAVAVSRAGGFAYITGTTHSTDFPTGSPSEEENAGSSDVFVAKFATNASGAHSLVYATYLGGKAAPGGPPRPCRRQGEGAVVDFAEELVDREEPDTVKDAVEKNSPVPVPEPTPTTSPPQSPVGVPCMPDPEAPPVNEAVPSVTPTYLYPNGTGGDDAAFGIAVDSGGIAYVTGATTSYDFPTTANAYDRHCGTRDDQRCDFSAHHNDVYLASDAFVSALNPSGSGLLYSTYLGGSGDRPDTNGDENAAERRPSGVDVGRAVATDGTGRAYVTGSTTSPDFPKTDNSALHPSTACRDEGVFPRVPSCRLRNPFPDAFLVKIDTTVTEQRRLESLAYGTYYDPDNNVAEWQRREGQETGNGPGGQKDAESGEGTGAGSGEEIGAGVALAVAPDPPGTVYVAGSMGTRHTPSGATGIGESGQGPPDAFVWKVNTTQGVTLGERFFGEKPLQEGKPPPAERAAAVAVDPAGNVHAVGQAETVGSQTRAFAVSYGPALPTTRRYTTYLGGSTPGVDGKGGDGASGVAVDSAGNAYVSGFTASHEFPTKEPIQAELRGRTDAFVAKLSPVGTVQWSTYLGGGATAGTLADGEDRARGVAVDDEGNAYVAGLTVSNDFPVVEPFQAERRASSDAFVARIAAAAGERPAIKAIEPSEGPPGTPVTITGAGFASGVTLHFGDVPVPASGLTVVSDTTITAFAPVPDQPGQPVPVAVRNRHGASRSGARYAYHQGSWAGAPAPPPATSTLRRSNVAAPTSVESESRWGERVAMAGHLDDDGYEDFFVGAPHEDVGGLKDAGRVYAMSGKNNQLLYQVASPEPQALARFGISVSVPGDLHGDGTPDVVIGADGQDVGNNCGFAEPNGCSEDQGKVWVFSCVTGTTPSEPACTRVGIDNPAPQGRAGNGAGFGSSIGRAGDVNADGVADVIVGAPDNDVPAACGNVDPAPAECHVDQGQAFVFSGTDGARLRTLDLPGAAGGCTANCGSFGRAVQGPGDVDGDGVTDHLVGAPGYSPTVGSGPSCGEPEPNGCNEGQGRMHLFSGRDGTLLRTIDSPEPQQGAAFGAQDAAPLSPGDVDGDGYDDVYGAAFEHDTAAGLSAGRSWVFSGKTGQRLYTLDDPTPGPGGRFGWALARTDHNGDGTPDLFVGSSPLEVSGMPSQRGGAYVLDGSDGALLESLELSPTEAPDATGGPALGSAVAAGDLNGDGQPDYIAGAPLADGENKVNQGVVLVFTAARPDGLDGATFTHLDGPACHSAANRPGYCGKVLVVGGGRASALPSTFTSLYDPAAGAWSPTSCADPGPACPAPTKEPRSGHSATSLADGSVLVVSGSSAEVYEPASGKWSHSANPVSSHGVGHTATLLEGPECHRADPPPHCGKVLVVGGNGSGATAELFDPEDPVEERSAPKETSGSSVGPLRRGRWAPTPPPADPRSAGHAATLLAGPGCGPHCGKVLVTGGISASKDGTNGLSAELFDPSTGTWTAAGTMAVPRANHSATRLADGKILVAGGVAGNAASATANPQSSAEIYDPATTDATKAWRLTGRMPGIRHSHTAVGLPGGQALVLGGHDGEREVVTALLYDPRGGSGLGGWQAAGRVPGAVIGPAALLWSQSAAADPARCSASCGGVLVGSHEAASALPASGRLVPRVDLYTPPPWVSATTASAGPVEGGVPLTIHGAGFAQGAQVLFGRTPAPGTFVSFGEMTATSPAMPSAVTPVRVARNLVGVGAGPVPFVTGGPAGVTDLHAEATGTDTINLSFSAPGAGGGMGPPARSYIVKQSRSPIGVDNFDAAKPLCEGGVCGGFEPGAVGTKLSLEVGGLLPGTRYHYAIKAVDDAGAVGDISNPASAVTDGSAPAPATALRSGCVGLPEPATGQVAYRAGYSLIALPAGTDPKADSRLFSWFDQGAGGSYSEHAPDGAMEAGRAYWAWGRCDRLVDLAGEGSSSASFALGAYRASMVGNPSGVATSTITGHDFTARWDPRLNAGAGGYEVSRYRQSQELAVGEGIWAFSYVPTTLVIGQR